MWKSLATSSRAVWGMGSGALRGRAIGALANPADEGMMVGAAQARLRSSRPLIERVGCQVPGNNNNPVFSVVRLNRMLVNEGENTWPRDKRHETPSEKKYRMRKQNKRKAEARQVRKLMAEALKMKRMGY